MHPLRAFHKNSFEFQVQRIQVSDTGEWQAHWIPLPLKHIIQNITGLLAEKNINILGSVINDGAEYGIIRMVVSDPETAAETLTKAGYLCKLIDVLGVEVEDKVGNLHELLKALYESNVNATYIYLSFNRESGKPIMVFHTEDITEVESCLKSKGFALL